MTAPINLVATAVKASTEDATDGNHVSKLFSTFDASDTPSARKYEAGRIVKNGSVEPVDLSINGSIILNTVTDRYSPGAMCKDTSVVPCRHLKAFLVSDKGVSRTMDTAAKTVVVYASGKLVKIYCVEYIKRRKKSVSGAVAATVGSPLAGDDECNYAMKETCSVVLPTVAEIRKSSTPSGSSSFWGDANMDSNYIVDIGVCCTGEVFQQSSVLC